MTCGLFGMPGHNARSCPKVLVATAKSKDVSKESPVPLKKVAMAKDDEASAEPPGVLDQAKPPTFLDKVTTDPCGNAVPFMCDKVLPWVDHVLQQKIKRGDYEQNLPGVARSCSAAQQWQHVERTATIENTGLARLVFRDAHILQASIRAPSGHGLVTDKWCF